MNILLKVNYNYLNIEIVYYYYLTVYYYYMYMYLETSNLYYYLLLLPMSAMYTHIHVHTYMYTHTCTHIHVHTHTCTHIYHLSFRYTCTQIKKHILAILNFTALLIEHSYARHIYNSTEVHYSTIMIHNYTWCGNYCCHGNDVAATCMHIFYFCTACSVMVQ